MIVRPLRRFDFSFRTSLFRRGTNETITQIISHREETLSLSEIIDYRYEERCEENGGSPWIALGKKKKKIDETWRASALSPLSPPQSRTGSKRCPIWKSGINYYRFEAAANSQWGGKGRAGLPGANRRNAVSIIQLKTDMYIGIRWELSQSLRLSIARRLSDDRSGRKIEGNAIVGWMQRPLPTLCRSLRFVASLILRSEVFESREGVMFRNLIVTFRIFLDQQINFLSFNMFSDL